MNRNDHDAPDPAATPDAAIRGTDKGFGALDNPRHTTTQLIRSRPSVFDAPFTTPLAVLHETALEHNITTMAAYCTRRGVSLAPHAKTTMAPRLFARQLTAGAWGLTAASIAHLRVYRSAGVRRIMLANQLVDPPAVTWLAREHAANPDLTVYCFVDSYYGIDLLDKAIQDTNSRQLPVLVEFGPAEHGRAGVRTTQDACALAEQVTGSRGLTLAGVAGWEGAITADTLTDQRQQVRDYCQQILDLARILDQRRLVADGFILTAGGSVWFDIIADELADEDTKSPRYTTVLRSGCYLIHDHLHYANRSPFAQHNATPRLRPALELWSHVISRPEPHLAILDLGRRDTGFDAGLPLPLKVRRYDGTITPADRMEITQLNDQHAFLATREPHQLDVGDRIALGISHPCTTLDKWRAIPIVNDDYHVVDIARTFF